MGKKSLHFAYAMTAGIASLAFAGSCQPHEGSEHQLKQDVDSFATYYFNWHFEQSAKYCTLGSRAWLRYACSNVTQADLDLLHDKEEDATVEVEDVNFGEDEVSATVSLKVNNFYRMDTIGTAAHHIDEAHIQLPMVLNEGKWQVLLCELPEEKK